MTSTPPPQERHVCSSRAGPNTPEHARIMQENRLRAKARIQQTAASVRKASTGQPQLELTKRKRSTEDVPSTSRSGNQAVVPTRGAAAAATTASSSKGGAPLARDSALGDYIEYDLSKLKNTKGGFLVEDEATGNLKTEQQILAERARELERIKAAEEPAFVLDPSKRPACEHCSSSELNVEMQRVFGRLVCNNCKREKPEMYSLLTKTEAKADYLLTDAELKDAETLPHLLRRNPHKSSYSNMIMYLRCQLEEFAFGPHKWGSEEALDAEHERREMVKSERANKKFKKGLNQLKLTTSRSVWQQRQDERHVHVFEDVELDEDEEGFTRQQCTECGLIKEEEEF